MGELGISNELRDMLQGLTISKVEVNLRFPSKKILARPLP